MSKRAIAITLMLTVAPLAASNAEITANVAVYDVGPLIGTGEEYVAYRVVIITSDTDDWTSAQIDASIVDATFYQDADNDGNPPDPNGFGAYPDSEFTTYYTSPEDYPNAAYDGGIVGFSAGPLETITLLQTDWYDSLTSADGTHIIAQVTVLPDSTSWSGTIDVTVFSTGNPGGVTDSFPISSADYSPPVTATYTGSSGGTYNDPNNWDISAVPLNVGLDRYNVIIPDSTDVIFDPNGENVISGLSHGMLGQFSFGGGQQLRVRGTAVLGGIVSVVGADAAFRAPSPFATFLDDSPRVFVSGGALADIAAPTYGFTRNLNGSYTILSADGAGSLLDLDDLSSVNVSASVGGGQRHYSIEATNGGVIDLSNVLTALGSASDDWMRFHADATSDIQLDSLTQVDSRVRFEMDVADYTLPSLNSFSNSVFEVYNGKTLNLPQLAGMFWSTLSMDDGSAVNAGALTNVTGSVIDLNPSRALTVPPFLVIDSARIYVADGASLQIDAGSYAIDKNLSASSDFLRASGAGSLLDFPQLTSISMTTGVGGGARTYTINADGGLIDLSSLTTVVGGPSDDWLRFRITAGGAMPMPNLATTTAHTWFDVEIPSYSLDSLTDVNDGGSFDLAEGTSLSAPVLQQIRGGDNELAVPVFATFDAPQLTSANDTDVYLGVGGTINAPQFTTFTAGWLTMGPGRFLNAPPFTDIDDSRLYVEGDYTFAVAAPSYQMALNFSSSQEIMYADGIGAMLDLSSLSSFSMPTGVGGGVRTYSVVARNDGVVDLSGATSVVGAASDDWLRFYAESDGEVLFGDVTIAGGRFKLEATDTGSTLRFAGDLSLNTPSYYTVALGALVTMAGDFGFDHTDETYFDTGAGFFHMNGVATQLFEAGGEDLGIPTGAISDNFEFGQLKVGQSDQATIVRLVDENDNGNHGGTGVEALYLQGFAGSDNGLRILGGSTLVVENIQVYAQVADEWVHINSLIPPGDNQVAYDDGFIALSIVVDDCNGNGIDDRVDILLGNSEDCNENEVPDDCDIAAGTSNDINLNGIPDECEDCDGNEIPDYLDMQDCDGSPWCSDCNNNTILDWCDINDGTSNDVDSNGVPDECEADCQPNGIPDQWDISQGTSQDCNTNGVPDECDIADETSNDINSNGIPDECETDCQPNGVPDSWDISQGFSQDCNTNGVPDECDIAGGFSDDVNSNGVPDECEPDCQPNGVPDGWDIATGTSEDCNENLVPDECDIALGTSIDSDSNGVPDECEDCNENGVLDYLDIANGTSEDCNGNMLPDECEAEFDVYAWIGPDGGSYADPNNWDLGGVPAGEVDIFNTTAVDNTCVLDTAGETEVCSLTMESTGGASQTLRIGEDSQLVSVNNTTLDANSVIHLTGGELSGGAVTSAGLIRGSGKLATQIDNSGVVESYAGGDLLITGSPFANNMSGVLRANFGTLVNVQVDSFTQAGRIEVSSAAAMLFAQPLTNEQDAAIEITGGSLGAPSLTNALGATVDGFGTFEANTSNAGEMTFVADTQIVGDVLNDGTITIQNGTLTILGALTNNGEIIGDFTGGKSGDGLPRAAGDGLFVQGSFTGDAGSSLLMSSPDSVVRLTGDYGLATTSNLSYDMAKAELQLVGGQGDQNLELMSSDIGPNPLGLDRTSAGRFPIGTLRIGPSATTVHLVDNHDNDGLGQGACEALYVSLLQIDSGTTLSNPSCKIYYDVLIQDGGVTNPENLIQIGIFGDINRDGSVELGDLATLLANFGATSGMSYADGDLDGDGDVDLADLAALLSVFGSGK